MCRRRDCSSNCLVRNIAQVRQGKPFGVEQRIEFRQTRSGPDSDLIVRTVDVRDTTQILKANHPPIGRCSRGEAMP